MHLIRSTYHFLLAHYILDSGSGDGTKKEYLEFYYGAFIIKFFRMWAWSNWVEILSRAMTQVIHNSLSKERDLSTDEKKR